MGAPKPFTRICLRCKVKCQYFMKPNRGYLQFNKAIEFPIRSFGLGYQEVSTYNSFPVWHTNAQMLAG